MNFTSSQIKSNLKQISKKKQIRAGSDRARPPSDGPAQIRRGAAGNSRFEWLTGGPCQSATREAEAVRGVERRSIK
jgi:hypothetical protein